MMTSHLLASGLPAQMHHFAGKHVAIRVLLEEDLSSHSRACNIRSFAPPEAPATPCRVGMGGAADSLRSSAFSVPSPQSWQNEWHHFPFLLFPSCLFNQPDLLLSSLLVFPLTYLGPPELANPSRPLSTKWEALGKPSPGHRVWEQNSRHELELSFLT